MPPWPIRVPISPITVLMSAVEAEVPLSLCSRMGDVFGKPAIVTDTHCIRLCNKLGIVKDQKEPKKVEMALWKVIPPQEGNDFCPRLVLHGRAVCTARSPRCENCCLADLCDDWQARQKEQAKAAKKAAKT